MGEPSQSDDFLAAGLAALEIEADEVEMAVMQAAHSVFWPAIMALLSADLAGIPAEPRPDLSRAPAGP